MTAFLVPHEYRVRAVATPPIPLGAWAEAGQKPKTFRIKAWSAEDAITQTEVQLGTRGERSPAWTITRVEPFRLEEGERLSGDQIVPQEDYGAPSVGFGT